MGKFIVKNRQVSESCEGESFCRFSIFSSKRKPIFPTPYCPGTHQCPSFSFTCFRRRKVQDRPAFLAILEADQRRSERGEDRGRLRLVPGREQGVHRVRPRLDRAARPR